MGTMLLLQCNVATASMEEMQAEIRHLEQLERRQQMKEKILTLRAKVIHVAAHKDCAMVTPLLQVQTGQAAGVPTIAMHIAELNPPDALTASAATATASLGHGVSGASMAGMIPPAFLAFYHLAYPYPLPSGRVPVPELLRFKAKNMLEWTSWKRAYKDMFCNNLAYFPNNASKVNLSLTYLETGPWDAIEKHFKARQSRAFMWEAFCSLLLDYVGPPETQQAAARLVFAKYKQHEDQSVRHYTEASAHLAEQPAEDYSQVEQAITYVTGL
jgi:hypothetical protein